MQTDTAVYATFDSMRNSIPPEFFDSLKERLVPEVLTAFRDLQANSPEQALMLAGRIVVDMNSGTQENPVLHSNFKERFLLLLEARLDVSISEGIVADDLYVAIYHALEGDT